MDEGIRGRREVEEGMRGRKGACVGLLGKRCMRAWGGEGEGSERQEIGGGRQVEERGIGGGVTE